MAVHHLVNSSAFNMSCLFDTDTGICVRGELWILTSSSSFVLLLTVQRY